MSDHAETKLAEEFLRLADELSREKQEQPTLERVVCAAVETIDSCDYCGVSLRAPDGQVATPACTDPVVAELDDLQYKVDQGPCLEAVWTLGTSVINDVTTENRWSKWCAEARQLGIRSMLSLQLDTGNGDVVGGLNLYARQPHAFDSVDVAIASILARHAGTAIAQVRTQEGLRSALRSRQIIGVAQGILMQRFGLSLDQSFELLRRYSQTRNVKLRTLATNLVQSGGLPTSSADGSSGTVEEQLQHSLGLARRDAAASQGSGRADPDRDAETA